MNAEDPVPRQKLKCLLDMSIWRSCHQLIFWTLLLLSFNPFMFLIVRHSSLKLKIILHIFLSLACCNQVSSMACWFFIRLTSFHARFPNYHCLLNYSQYVLIQRLLLYNPSLIFSFWILYFEKFKTQVLKVHEINGIYKLAWYFVNLGFPLWLRW